MKAWCLQKHPFWVSCSSTIPHQTRVTIVPMSAVSCFFSCPEHETDIDTAFLSWLRLATYMAVTSVAIVTSFHLKSKPSQLEMRMAVPFGVVFWVLSLACLVSGFANYFKTIVKYSRRTALVQSGWKTETVSQDLRKPGRSFECVNLTNYRFSRLQQLPL